MRTVVRRSEGERTPKARAVVGVVVFAVIAAAIAMATLVNLARGELLPPSAAGRLAGPVEVAELRYRFALANAAVSEELRDDARVAVSRLPLADFPFLLIGAREIVSRESRLTPANRVALAESLRRNPRSRAARLLLVRGNGVEGRVAEAVREIALLDRVDNQISQELVREAGKGLSSRAMVSEAVTSLRPYPRLLENLTVGFASVERSDALLRQYVSLLPASALRRPALRAPLVQRLVENGEVALAYRIAGAAQTDSSRRPLLVDQRFEPSKRERPFAWDLLESDVGVAERQDGGGVFVEYYGRKSGPVARQLAVLGPGRYTAVLDYEAGEANALALRIRCAGADTSLLTLRLADGAIQRRTARQSFTVPPSCEGQWVEIAGLPQITRREARGVIHSVSITRSGA